MLLVCVLRGFCVSQNMNALCGKYEVLSDGDGDGNGWRRRRRRARESKSESEREDERERRGMRRRSGKLNYAWMNSRWNLPTVPLRIHDERTCIYGAR